MQLRSGPIVKPSTPDSLPSVSKRKALFQASSLKQRKSFKGQTPKKNSKASHRKQSLYNNSSSSKLQLVSKTSLTQGKKQLTNSHPQYRKYRTTTEDSRRGQAPLTAENLKLHSQSQMPRTRKVPSTKSANDATSTTTTEKRFGVQLTKNGILYGRLKTKKPKDINTVKEYLENDRQSISPDEEAYNRYVEQVEWSDNELSMQSNTWPLLAKQPSCTNNAGYTANYNFQWTEVETPLTYGLSDAKPDISESYRWDQYPIEACEALGGSLVPTQYGGAMPALCAEWKGPDGTMLSAEKQCAYDGALMVEAAGHVHEYMMKDLAEFLDETQALTLALNGEYIHLYSNHAKRKGSSFEYHQYPLCIYKPRDSLKDFKLTYRSIRNAQDWARHRATKTKDDLHAFMGSKVAASTTLNQQADETNATGTAGSQNTEHDRHHGVHHDGCNQGFTPTQSVSFAAPQPPEISSVEEVRDGVPQTKLKRTRKGRKQAVIG